MAEQSQDVSMHPPVPPERGLPITPAPTQRHRSPRPGPQDAGSSRSTTTTGKRKRTEDGPNTPPTSSSQSKKPRAEQTRSRTKAAMKKAKKSGKPKGPNDWHLKKGEVPKDSAKTKVRYKFIYYFRVLNIAISLRRRSNSTFVPSGACLTRTLFHR